MYGKGKPSGAQLRKLIIKWYFGADFIRLNVETS